MNAKKSKGAAVIIFFLVLVMAGASVVLTKSNQIFKASDALETQKALSTAKAALIQYALTHPTLNGYGYLPCPDDISNGTEGKEDGNCTSVGKNALGHFPWKTLGTIPLYDSSGECLWYAVSGNFKNHSSGMWNPDMDDDDEIDKGALNLFAHDGTQINGTSADGSDRIVALVIAPGKNIKNKERTARATDDFCRPDYDASHFLETYQEINNAEVSDTIGNVDDFIVGTASTEQSGDLNDQFIIITRSDVEMIETSTETDERLENMTEALALCIAEYGKNNSAGSDDNRLPNPAAITMSDYYTDSSYDDNSDDTLKFGRLPYDVTNSASTTSNNLSTMTPSDMRNKLFSNCTNLTVDGTSVNLSNPNDPLRKAWKNWKYNILYSVSSNYSSNSSTPTSPCLISDTSSGVGDTKTCVQVANPWTYGGLKAYAAVVLFGGRKEGANTRNIATTTTEKDTLSNYFEEANIGSYVSLGDLVFQTWTGNDILFCIDHNLDVSQC